MISAVLRNLRAERSVLPPLLAAVGWTMLTFGLIYAGMRAENIFLSANALINQHPIPSTIIGVSFFFYVIVRSSFSWLDATARLRARELRTNIKKDTDAMQSEIDKINLRLSLLDPNNGPDPQGNQAGRVLVFEQAVAGDEDLDDNPTDTHNHQDPEIDEDIDALAGWWNTQEDDNERTAHSEN